jgi:hypothetical protein
MPETLLAAARKLEMRTLRESGLERVWDGVTSLDELIRVWARESKKKESHSPFYRSRRRPPRPSRRVLRWLLSVARRGSSLPTTILRCDDA